MSAPKGCKMYNKSIDYTKRKNQEGSYSLYNHLYNYLLNNYEPSDIRSANDKRVLNLLLKEGIAYAIKGGKSTNKNYIVSCARKAVSMFISNNGEHGDTANNLGKVHANSFNNIKKSIMDLGVYK